MQRVLVVGLGEIGGTILRVLQEANKFKVFGLDVDKKKMEEYSAQSPEIEPENQSIDVMHICIPVADQTKFIEIIKAYIQKYHPNITIINSTVPIGTTIELYKQCACLIAHSPCRGVHKNKEYMKQEFKRWTKYVGGATPEASLKAKDHFEQAGLKTKVMPNCNDTEFAKLFETTYRTWMIVFFQKMHRLARKYSSRDFSVKINFDETVEFIEDTHRIRHDRPIMFPDVIGGHCLLPNSKLLLEEFEPEMLKLITQSNEERKKEMKNLQIAEETKKVSLRVSAYETEQDKEVMGLTTK